MKEIQELTNQQLYDIAKRHAHHYNPFIKGLEGGMRQADIDVGELLMQDHILKAQIRQLKDALEHERRKP